MSEINISIKSNLFFDLNPNDLKRKLGLKLTENTRKRFLKGVSPEGTAWKSKGNDQPSNLRKRSHLMNSIDFKINGDTIVIGTNKKYAKIHNEGGVITPKKGKYLYFKGDDGNLRKVTQVVIPQRKFLGLSKEDERDIKKLTFSSFIME